MRHIEGPPGRELCRPHTHTVSQEGPALARVRPFRFPPQPPPLLHHRKGTPSPPTTYVSQEGHGTHRRRATFDHCEVRGAVLRVLVCGVVLVGCCVVLFLSCVCVTCFSSQEGRERAAQAVAQDGLALTRVRPPSVSPLPPPTTPQEGPVLIPPPG